MTSRYLPTRLRLFLTLFLALLLLTVQGCFHSSGGGGGTVADADPTGYYTNTGDASVGRAISGNPVNGTTSISDLQALVDGNRIMMMSVAKGLFYDGTITNISGNNFTADFTVYEGDEFPVTAPASGIITAGSSITGTLTGSGFGSGTFSLLYAKTNTEVADVARIENVAGVNTTWGAKIGGGVFAQEFIIDNMGGLTHDTPSLAGIFSSCEMNGDIIPISNSSLYKISVVLTKCGSSLHNGIYAGLATSRTDAVTDDTLVIAVADGRYSLESDFK